MKSLLVLTLIGAAGCGSPSGAAPMAIDDVAPTTVLGPDDFAVEPGTLAWDALDATTFDPEWLLPERPADDEGDLVAAMRALVAYEFVVDGETLLLGDLVRRGGDRAAREALLARLTPEARERHGDALRELLFDDVLMSESWKPSKDSDGDGILFGESWRLPRDKSVGWRAKTDLRIEQAAIVFQADIPSIKAAENDYRQYPRNIGASYEAIYPTDDTYLRGQDQRGSDFAVHRIYFRCDLPFPFSNYECALHVLTRTSPAGELVTDIFSPSDDFHYMLGKDVFLPVTTAGGDTVGVLCVRLFGFDLDGVPDDAGNRREAMRSSLGNLRRNAERIFRASAAGSIVPDFAVPRYELLGTRSADG